jgi:exosome complex component RRP41
MGSDIKLMDESRKRLDGRQPTELRPIKIEAGVLKRADGSAYIEWGENKIMAAVYGPRELHPRFPQNATKAYVKCNYNMAPFSVGERKRPGPDRRSSEISKIIAEALDNVIFTNQFPKAGIEIYIEVLEASAGTRCAGLTAASVALADAGIPMKDMVPACAVGKINGKLVVDLNKEEDNFGEADLPMAISPRTGELLLLQMDGDLTVEELERALEMGGKACIEIHKMQRAALKARYSTGKDSCDTHNDDHHDPSNNAAKPAGGEPHGE